MTEKLSEQAEAYYSEYVALSHAMQSGVAMEMNYHPNPTSPKHLRVGVNSAMVEHAALVRLLVSKGIITDEEYCKALRDGMKEEVSVYQKRLSEHFGREVTLA